MRFIYGTRDESQRVDWVAGDERLAADVPAVLLGLLWSWCYWRLVVCLGENRAESGGTRCGSRALSGRARVGVDRFREFEDLVGEFEELSILPILFFHCLPLLSGYDLAFCVGSVWLIITKVERKIASSETIMVKRP